MSTCTVKEFRKIKLRNNHEYSIKISDVYQSHPYSETYIIHNTFINYQFNKKII